MGFRLWALGTRLAAACLALVLAGPATAQTLSPGLQSTLDLFQQVRVTPDIVYSRANGWEGRLDVYAQRGPGPHPTVIYIHGGGWVEGSKDQYVLNTLPYLAMGYSVVNVAYRLADVSLAPAAIEDCRCALRWVVENARAYGIDPDRLVVAGFSAGGHLALMIGLVPADAGFDRACYGVDAPRVRAIVNFSGIADVADLLDGPGRKPFPERWPYGVQWLGNQPDRAEVARAASPLTWVRAGAPPTMSIHGDADPLVPYAHSVRLHEALARAGVAHEFVTIPGGGHGGYSADEWRRAYAAIQAFLETHVMNARPAAATAR